MNQIFRIAIGPETIEGKLPSLRVGQGYGSLFNISGITSVEPAPKVWIKTDDEEPAVFFEGTWDTERGLWEVDVGSSISQIAGSYLYAITVNSAVEGDPTYIAGQGSFVVYSNIASDGGDVGEAGATVLGLIADLTARVGVLEAASGIGDIAVMTTGIIPIDAGSISTSIVVDPAVYGIASAMVMAPTGATVRYSATMVREDVGGYTVFYSSTVAVAGYSLRYMLFKK